MPTTDAVRAARTPRFPPPLRTTFPDATAVPGWVAAVVLVMFLLSAAAWIGSRTAVEATEVAAGLLFGAAAGAAAGVIAAAAAGTATAHRYRDTLPNRPGWARTARTACQEVSDTRDVGVLAYQAQYHQAAAGWAADLARRLHALYAAAAAVSVLPAVGFFLRLTPDLAKKSSALDLAVPGLLGVALTVVAAGFVFRLGSAWTGVFAGWQRAAIRWDDGSQDDEEERPRDTRPEAKPKRQAQPAAAKAEERSEEVALRPMGGVEPTPGTIILGPRTVVPEEKVPARDDVPEVSLPPPPPPPGSWKVTIQPPRDDADDR